MVKKLFGTILVATAILMGAAMLMAGCDDMVEYDQCMRVDLFERCMKNIPVGPTQVKFNDWEEVVSACNNISAQQSTRKARNIKPECR